MFKYDPNKVPSVRLQQEWQLSDKKTIAQSYQVGNWSMELPEDGNIKQVREAIYAWIAWHDFLESNEKIKHVK